MKICLFGGTFSPIHIGHLQMAKQVLDSLKFDAFYFIPTGDSYLKTDVLDAKLRLEMTRLGVKDYFGEDDRVIVSDVEVLRDGPSYSYETVLYFKERFTKEQLYFLVGEDSVCYMDKWKNPSIIFDNAKILVCKRSLDKDQLSSSIASLNKAYGADISVFEYDMPISSTYIRDNIYDGDKCKKMVTDSVYKYILDNNIYKDL